MSSEMLVHKVTLSSGKVILIKNPRIKDQELAARAAQISAKDPEIIQAMALKKELLKMLIVKIDDKTPSKMDIEDLDSLFTFQEYGQLTQVLNKLIGGDSDMGNFSMEIVTTGGK